VFVLAKSLTIISIHVLKACIEYIEHIFPRMIIIFGYVCLIYQSTKLLTLLIHMIIEYVIESKLLFVLDCCKDVLDFNEL
jgi:hypothetical protein